MNKFRLHGRAYNTFIIMALTGNIYLHRRREMFLLLVIEIFVPGLAVGLPDPLSCCLGSSGS